MNSKLLTLSIIVSAFIGATGVSNAQTAPAASEANKEPAAEAKKDAAKVYHGGGKHDQKAHEASIRAKEAGKGMAQTNVHSGGKHDVQGHKAALKAEQKEATESTAKK